MYLHNIYFSFLEMGYTKKNLQRKKFPIKRKSLENRKKTLKKQKKEKEETQNMKYTVTKM